MPSVRPVLDCVPRSRSLVAVPVEFPAPRRSRPCPGVPSRSQSFPAHGAEPEAGSEFNISVWHSHSSLEMKERLLNRPLRSLHYIVINGRRKTMKRTRRPRKKTRSDAAVASQLLIYQSCLRAPTRNWTTFECASSSSAPQPPHRIKELRKERKKKT